MFFCVGGVDEKNCNTNSEGYNRWQYEPKLAQSMLIQTQRGKTDGDTNPKGHNRSWRFDLACFPSFSCNNKMNQRRISCEPWLRLQRAHLGKLCWNFNEHVQGLHQRRAVEDPNLCFLHLLFRDSQVSGVVQLFNLSPSNLPALLPCCYCHVAACVAWRVL